MINVPTTLFIDTSYCISQGMKFTTAEIDKLRKLFQPKSLRLVLPAVAQRELKRKFAERADAAVQVVHSAGQEYPINLLEDWPYSSTDKTEVNDLRQSRRLDEGRAAQSRTALRAKNIERQFHSHAARSSRASFGTS